MNQPEPSPQLSPTLSQPLNEREDLTWLDFLRSARSTASSEQQTSRERQTSADRKRRYTGSEPERRNCPSSANTSGRQPVLCASGAAARLGLSQDHAVNATASPGPRPQISRRHGSDSSARSSARGRRSSDQLVQRRPSDMVLPKWQPDADVSKCPVCEADFSFWYRKHHCRKCGRVVCAACSPHRITIPRQYIVQPPDASDQSATHGDDEYDNPALGGGEVVRVCNPCVPDPWTPHNAEAPARAVVSTLEDQQQQQQQQQRSSNLADFLHEHRQRTSAGYSRRAAPLPPLPQPSFVPAPPSQSAHSRQRSQTHQSLSSPRRTSRSLQPAELQHLLNTQILQHGRQSAEAGLLRQAHVRRHTHSLVHSGPAPIPPSASSYAQRYQHRRSPSIPDGLSTSSAATSTHAPPPLPSQRPLPRTPPQPLPQPPPRRQVREEDECPVCGIEMPPGDSVREAHIQECIATRFSSTPGSASSGIPIPQAASAAAAAATTTAGSLGLQSASVSATPPLPQPQHSSSVPTASRPRATSYRPRGMAISRATEKDCTSADGQPQECVICFEEFQPGDELGRMECLCSFHRACIRQWWETKGQGSCPTHQLHD